MRIRLFLLAAMIALPAFSGCSKEEDSMNQGELRQELEEMYGTVRTAFENYDLDTALKYVDLPEGAPMPSRPQVQAMADFLPKLGECRFIDLVVKGNRAAYYTESELDVSERSEVTVVRFVKGEAGWRLAPAPHTISAYNGEKTDEAGLMRMIEEQESLVAFPEGDPEEVPPPSGSGEAAGESDNRKDSEVQQDLEALWCRLRTALIAGDVDAAKRDMLLDDDQQGLTAEDARRFGTSLNDLTKCRFLKLGWRRDKPEICGYYTEADVDNPEQSTIVMIVFGYKDGRWWFVPGPVSIEEAPVDKTDREGLLKEIETNPDLRL